MQPRNDVVRLRLTTAEREAWSRAAGGKGRLSEWVRAICNTASIAGLRAELPEGINPPYEHQAKAMGLPLADTTAASTQVVSADAKCARWMHHRKGVYCGTCKQVN